jgi:hypothetical protein
MVHRALRSSRVLLAPAADGRHGRVVTVIGDGTRRVADAVAGQPGAPAEVDVLEEHEVGRVEAADLLEDRPPDHQRGAGAEEHVALDVQRRLVVLADVELERLAVPGLPGVDEVDLRSVPVQHLGGDHADVAAREQDRDRLAEEPRVGTGVVVDEGHHVGGAAGRAEVAARREADVGGGGHHRDVRVGGADGGHVVAGAGVVHHDELQPAGRPVHLLEGVEAGHGVCCPVVVHEDDADRGAGRVAHGAPSDDRRPGRGAPRRSLQGRDGADAPNR